MKDRRYIYQLQLVKVPVKWTARIRPGLQPVTRRMTDKRIRTRRNRLAAHKFMAAMFGPSIFIPDRYRMPKFETQEDADKFINWCNLMKGRKNHGPDAGHEGSGRDLKP